MRHGCKVNHLSRTHSHRIAMMSNMATSLIMHKRVETTLAKAKALRVYVEPIINRSKEDSTHNRRIVFSYLHSKEAVNELFREVSQKVANRPGGYTRILKTGIRKGDNSEMAIIELVDYNENMLKEPKAKKAKSTRRGRGGKKAEETAAVDTPATEAPVAEAPAAEEPKAE
ncbi:MAG: 50S ribosomal protein L17 [Bacteroidales bacterium]|nr:50S ribosomal protein L17 [Bacteroidales bacterium]